MYLFKIQPTCITNWKVEAKTAVTVLDVREVLSLGNRYMELYGLHSISSKMGKIEFNWLQNDRYNIHNIHTAFIILHSANTNTDMFTCIAQLPNIHWTFCSGLRWPALTSPYLFLSYTCSSALVSEGTTSSYSSSSSREEDRS